MIAIIAARSKNNVIGKGGRIPWKIRGEQKQFRELTMGNAVVMGRRTYEEIGRPLPGRMNIIVSSAANYSADNLITVKTFAEAVKAAGDRDIFVSGGFRLFKEALPFADRLYLTEVDAVIEDGDTFFPYFDPEDFIAETGETAGEPISFTRVTYFRKTAPPAVF